MPRDEERREKRRSHSRRKDRRSASKDRSQAGGGWVSALFGNRLCCCSEVRCCPGGERIEAKGSRRHRSRGDRDAGRDERRRHRRHRDRDRDRDQGGGGRGDGEAREDHRTGRPPGSEGHGSGGGDDDGYSEGAQSARSYVSASSYAGGSYASQTTGLSEATSARGGRRSGRESERDRGRPGRAGGGAGDAGAVKVLNLADLKGQELPGSLEKQPQAPVAEAGAASGRRGGEQDGAPLSARSGRSEGGRSCRSEGAQSIGGASVASVSVKQYMGYLSEQRSPTEVKKMVKEFVRQMVKGREMGVLRADGALKPVLCGLTRSLDVFRIKSGADTRKVKLAEVMRVVHGAPEDLADLETPLDDLCSTLELESSECISFKFAERKAAELFTLCMQLFIDGQRR